MSTIWTAWLVAFAVSFSILEGYAWFTGTQMLTHWVRAATVVWPWVPYLFGAAAVALVLHFWFE